MTMDHKYSFKDLTVELNSKPKDSTVQQEVEGLRIEEIQRADEGAEAQRKVEPQGSAAVLEQKPDVPEGGSSSNSFINNLLFIVGIALGAVVISSWIAGVAANKGGEIATRIEDTSGSSTVSESGEGTIDAADGTAPTASTPSLDISGALPYLGYAGLGAGGVVVTVLGIGGAKKLRRRNLELRELEEARAEDRRKAQAAWQKYADIHSELKAKILEAETDWDLLFKYPTLVDATVPQTRELHRAIRAVDAAPADAPAELNLSMDIGSLPYPKLVMEAQEAWNGAWSFAQRTGTKLIPKPERKKIDQIVQLLKLARDGGGSEHERSVAYERASKLISELHFVRVPEIAMRSIEAERRRMIEAPAAVAISV